MYINCVFNANLKDNKRLHILQGHFFKTTKNNYKFIENRYFIQLVMDFYEWPEYETLFLQLEFRGWTGNNSIG